MFDDANNQTSTPQPAPAAPAAPATTPPATPVAPGTATGSAEEIHTMPMDYYTGGKTANVARASQPMNQTSGSMAPAPGGRKKILNIAIIAGLVLVVGVSAYLLYASYQQPASDKSVVKEEPKTEEPATEDPAVTDGDVPPPVDIPVEEPKDEGIKFDPSKLSEVSLSLMASLDKDKDGLTDAEEALIGTDPNINDTDKDTYRDGDEMKNFYSPLNSGGVKLSEVAFVKSYENPNYGYKLLYPAGWLASPLKADDPKEVMFTSKGNEFVSIFVDTKGTMQTLDSWYLEKAPSVTATQLKKYQNYRKVAVLESPDGFTAYIASNDKVFILNYNIGLNEEASFPGLFAMMINSFELIPVQPTALAPSVDFSGIMKALNVSTPIDNAKVVTDFTCGTKTCFYDSFNACEASVGVFKLTDNLTYEINVTGREGEAKECYYSSRFTKIDNTAWAGKIMKCKYDPAKGFDVAIKLLVGCTGDLVKLIQPEQP